MTPPAASPTAESVARFENRHGHARLRQRARRGQAAHAAADDERSPRGCLRHVVVRSAAGGQGSRSRRGEHQAKDFAAVESGWSAHEGSLPRRASSRQALGSQWVAAPHGICGAPSA
jgi:hypothetical protein